MINSRHFRVNSGIKSGVSFFKPMDEVIGYQYMIIFYEDTDVQINEEIPVMSLWVFISSCGGTLGLFLGFSCHSAIFYCLKGYCFRL